MREIVLLNESDNVATCLRDLDQGVAVELEIAGAPTHIVTQQAIAFGHKIAIRHIPAGESVLKYGEVIGRASCPIDTGDWVHVHNIESVRGRGDLS